MCVYSTKRECLLFVFTHQCGNVCCVITHRGENVCCVFTHQGWNICCESAY